MAGLLTTTKKVFKKSQNFNFSRGQESLYYSACLFSVIYNFELSKISTRAGKLIAPSERTHLVWVSEKISFSN